MNLFELMQHLKNTSVRPPYFPQNVDQSAPYWPRNVEECLGLAAEKFVGHLFVPSAKPHGYPKPGSDDMDRVTCKQLTQWAVCTGIVQECLPEIARIAQVRRWMASRPSGVIQAEIASRNVTVRRTAEKNGPLRREQLRELLAGADEKLIDRVMAWESGLYLDGPAETRVVLPPVKPEDWTMRWIAGSWAGGRYQPPEELRARFMGVCRGVVADALKVARRSA